MTSIDDESALQRATEGINRQVELRVTQVLARVQTDLKGQSVEKIRPVLEQRIRDEVPLFQPSAEALDSWAARFADS